jgi:hypothetical protein
VAAARHSDHPIEVQSVGGVTDNKQLFFTPAGPGSWVEVEFAVEQDVVGDLSARFLHAKDYGIYKILLDGRELAVLDLYDANLNPKPHRLGQQELKAGRHVLRFEGTGKGRDSKGYFLGFDTLNLRVPVYARPARKDLRDLQVK